MKRLLTLLGIFLAIFVLAGCASDGSKDDSDKALTPEEEIATPTNDEVNPAELQVEFEEKIEPVKNPFPPVPTPSFINGLPVSPDIIERMQPKVNARPTFTPLLDATGVPPGTIWIFGNLENPVSWDRVANGECYWPGDAGTPGCEIDKSDDVVGGALVLDYTKQLFRNYWNGYILNNEFRFSGQIWNTIAREQWFTFGTPPRGQFTEACGYFWRHSPNVDPSEATDVSDNPYCWGERFEITWIVDGDDSVDGWDFAPALDGDESIQVSASHMYDRSLVDINSTWDGTQYSLTYSDTTTGQALYATILIGPVIGPGDPETIAGVDLRVVRVDAGGSCDVITELVHIENFDDAGGYWPAYVVNSINADCSINQDANNKADHLGDPT